MLTLDEVRDLVRSEKKSVALQPLPLEFFDEVKKYLEEKHKLLGGKYDGTIKEDIEAMIKSVSELITIRLRKISQLAALHLDASFHNTENMTPREEDIYYAIIDFLKAKREEILAKVREIKKEKVKMLRILEDIPAFRWRDKVYGPFKKEDVVMLPKEVREILINRGKAMEIEVEK